MLAEEKLPALPQAPGVYWFKNAHGEVLYVGKAAVLRNRVRSYFAPPHTLSSKVEQLMERVEDLEFIVTDSEQEALILEYNLIKQHRPRFNVHLKDDKSYPYLKIELQEKWPRIYVTRNWEQDGSRYFGPYASARSVRQTMAVLRKLFPFRTCNRNITGTDKRACLKYDIHRCIGPCVGAAAESEYRRVIRQVILFLEGRDQAVQRELRRRMEEASRVLDFERAAVLRDQIAAVKGVTESQKISSTLRKDVDVVAMAEARDMAYIQVFFIRGGRLIGREPYVVEGARDETPPDIMAGFLQQFYGSSPNIPPLILLQHPMTDSSLLVGWLKERRGGAVRLHSPRRGEGKGLVDLAAQNACQGLKQYRITRIGAADAIAEALHQLQQSLGLGRLPQRIEAYDISNIQGAWAVGGMVVFEHGRPKPTHYRRFRIRNRDTQDDYAMLREVLHRRLGRGEGFNGVGPWHTLPDFMLLDGGKGQLSAALEVLSLAGLNVPAAALAKEEEQVFAPGSPHPLPLSPSSPALLMLQRIRDEAHRYALSYHIRTRQRSATQSALDAVPGIGPRRRKELLRRFGSVRAIRESTLEEIASTPSITTRLAHLLKQSV
ncbi:MAG: excinuclease ABC subunit UvrC [Dehalococcoidia bacterium]|nr:excinuclease ABC subunit UvrC [Dehalococcoidia bacterium]